MHHPYSESTAAFQLKARNYKNIMTNIMTTMFDIMLK